MITTLKSPSKETMITVSTLNTDVVSESLPMKVQVSNLRDDEVILKESAIDKDAQADGSEETTVTIPLDVDEGDDDVCDSISSEGSSKEQEDGETQDKTTNLGLEEEAQEATDTVDETKDNNEETQLEVYDSSNTPMPSLTSKPKKSILKKTENDFDISTTSKKSRFFKVVCRSISDSTRPQPPLEDKNPIRRCKSETGMQRTVTFDHVEFRHYECTLGDNPSCSYGPPIQLDWSYVKIPSLNIDEYESDRLGKRRNLRQMLLNYYMRMNLLTWGFGYSEAEIKAATKSVKHVKFQRTVTKALLPLQKAEEVMQSANRKAKRACGYLPPKQKYISPIDRQSSIDCETEEEFSQGSSSAFGYV